MTAIHEPTVPAVRRRLFGGRGGSSVARGSGAAMLAGSWLGGGRVAREAARLGGGQGDRSVAASGKREKPSASLDRVGVR
jgi:hypothetical protein